MKRLAWLTDLHLDFVDSDAEVAAFCQHVAASGADAVLIGGDIATATTLERSLRLFEKCLQRPIYFVLGNHDFYGGTISEVRKQVVEICRRSEWLHWLPQTGIIELGDDACLVGHDSWADGRHGQGVRSTFVLNDYYCIRDFRDLSQEEWFARLHALGDEAAAFLRDILPRGFDRCRRVILLTHVPPFREAAWHLGGLSDDNAAPHFTCKAVGDVLLEVMRSRPNCRLIVLCGHTHSPGTARITPNIEVHTGRAEYGTLQLQPEVKV
jgi:Icc protein